MARPRPSRSAGRLLLLLLGRSSWLRFVFPGAPNVATTRVAGRRRLPGRSAAPRRSPALGSSTVDDVLTSWGRA